MAARRPGRAGPDYAYQFGRRADLKGDYALFAAFSPNDNTEDPGIYAFRNITAGPGAAFFDDIDSAGLADPIRPEPPFSQPAAIQRFTGLAMLNDAEALAARAVISTTPPTGSLEASLIPINRSGLVWSYGDLVPLPGFTTVTFLKSTSAGNLALFGSTPDRRAAIARKGTGTWAVTETLPSPAGSDDFFGDFGAIQGATLFVGARKADLGGTDRGLVYLYERTPELSSIGKQSFKTTKKKVILKGTSTDVSAVTYKFGKGGFKTARGSASSWKIPVKLKSGNNIIRVIGTGPGGTSSLLKFKVRRKDR